MPTKLGCGIKMAQCSTPLLNVRQHEVSRIGIGSGVRGRYGSGDDELLRAL